MAYTPTTPVGVLLSAYAAKSATWEETMDALRGLSMEEWGIAGADLDPDAPEPGDPDWWQSVEDRALGSPVGTGSPLTDLRRARRAKLITPDEYEQVYALVSEDEE